MVFAFTNDTVSLTINGSKECHQEKLKTIAGWDDQKIQIT